MSSAHLAVIDHLVLFVADLTTGCDRMEAALGVRPVFGGQHLGLGTHNALVALGDSYLELIAADPEQPEPPGPRPFGIDDLGQSQLVTFAVRPAPGHTIEELIAAASDAGHETGPVVSMTRMSADGVELHWRLTFPSGDRLIPFFIDWGDTPNPATTAPPGPTLVGLSGTTDEPESTNTVLGRLGLPQFAARTDADRPKFAAELSNGVEL